MLTYLHVYYAHGVHLYRDTFVANNFDVVL
jgi:hypothetical protein